VPAAYDPFVRSLTVSFSSSFLKKGRSKKKVKNSVMPTWLRASFVVGIFGELRRRGLAAGALLCGPHTRRAHRSFVSVSQNYGFRRPGKGQAMDPSAA